MIEELHIRGLGVIEDATLRLSPGLTVITGETGAGKTMVVTALQLLLGARADAALVRAGADTALAEAVVVPAPPEADAWDLDGDALFVTRELPAQGRSRARVAGRLAPVSALAEVLGQRVEVHGQHEHVRLGRAEVQRDLLDRFAGPSHARNLAAYRDAHEAWRQLQARLDGLEDDARERAREADRLRYEVAEIDAARLDPEVDATIDEELDRLAHAEELREAATGASLALGAEGAQEPIGVALDALRRAPVADPEVEALRERAQALAAEAAELARDARGYAEGIEADPARLAELQERKRVVTGLIRKYGPEVSDVVASAERARARLAELEAEEADAGDLEERVAAAHEQATTLAAELRAGRRAAADELAAAVDEHLADLGMPHARFSVEVEAAEDLAVHGGDRVRFQLAANPGEPALPLARAASGGERSRVSLAVEVALADVDDVQVLVFDEVDAGIGGATAMAVGEKLARLAVGERQVLCVTHLAQLAAFADVHHVVEKGVRDGRTVTTSRPVAEDHRVAELARMLGGDATATAGLEHARELLETARRRRMV